MGVPSQPYVPDGDSNQLPGYSERNKSEHVYDLKSSNGKAWLTLKVINWSPPSKPIPLFTEGDVIKGSVQLDLPKPESAKEVNVNVRGEVTAVGQEPLPFLDLTSVLWVGTKLSGKQSWDFSIQLPRTVDVSDVPKGKEKTHVLPPGFSERASAAYIDYKIIVTVRRGTFRVNQTLGTSFGYFPRLVAPVPSPLRQLAYSEGNQLIGPDGDPEGWKVLPPVSISGSIFGTKQVTLQCTLSIGAPLIYAPGSPVPLTLVLSCEDEQALDLLSTTSATCIFLTRSIAIGSGASDDDAPRRSNNTFQEHIGKAFFWPSTEGAPTPGIRRLTGEIEVPRNSKPSFLFARFSQRHYVTFYSFNASGFVSDISPTQSLAMERVYIATENAPGVRPHSHAPPGYVREEVGDYNNSVGYLENGNQRFYHHHGGGFN